MKNKGLAIYLFINFILVSKELYLTNEQNEFVNMIENEKNLIDKLKLNLAKNSHILTNLDQQINLKSENKVCGKYSCFFLDKEKSNQKRHIYNKNMVLKEVLFDNFNERILNFHILPLGKTNSYDKYLPKNQKNNYLILFFTSNTFYVSDPKGKILQKETFNTNITRVDFSTYDEGELYINLDNIVVFLTDKSELHLINFDLKFNGSLIPYPNGNFTEEFSVYIKISAQKSRTIDIENDEIVNFQQNRLMSNKYIIIGLRKGSVIVFTRDLELRSSFMFPNSINNIYIHQGILGVFVNKQLVFMNMLGGNQVVVSCYNYFSMIEAVYDGLNNFLLAVDYTGNLLIFNAKIALSKQNSNECTQIYKYKIKNFNKYAKLKLYRQNLYIFTDTNYVAIVDLKHISDNGIFFVNEYFISHKNTMTLDFISNTTFSPTIEGNFISVEQGTYLFLKNEFLQEKNSFVIAKISNNKKIEKMIESNNLDGNDIITLPLGTAKSDSNWSMVGIYFFAIVVISLIVFYFKKKKSNNEISEKIGIKNMKKKNYNEEQDPKALEDMLSKLKNIEKATKEIKNIKSKNKNDKRVEEDDIEIEDIDEEEEVTE